MADQAAAEDAPFSFVVPAGSFSDADGDTLSYSASLQGGAALPSWLSFDPATRTLRTPPARATSAASASPSPRPRPCVGQRQLRA